MVEVTEVCESQPFLREIRRLRCSAVTAEVTGSSPAAPAIYFTRIHNGLWIIDSGCGAISGRFLARTQSGSLNNQTASSNEIEKQLVDHIHSRGKVNVVPTGTRRGLLARRNSANSPSSICKTDS